MIFSENTGLLDFASCRSDGRLLWGLLGRPDGPIVERLLRGPYGRFLVRGFRCLSGTRRVRFVFGVRRSSGAAASGLHWHRCCRIAGLTTSLVDRQAVRIESSPAVLALNELEFRRLPRGLVVLLDVVAKTSQKSKETPFLK